MIYDGQCLKESLHGSRVVIRSRESQEWLNAKAVLDALPLHAHLLLLSESSHSRQYFYRLYNIPSLEGTMVQCAIRFSSNMLIDVALQITHGLKAMHKVGIIHQNLNPSVLWVARSNQFVSGHRIIIGGFEKSGRRVLGQSLLNPTRPSPDWDIKRLYIMGKQWNIPNWPLEHSLDHYEAWLWMQPVENYLKPTSLLITVLRMYKETNSVIKRLEYICRCSVQKYRTLGEVEVTNPSVDADVLAIAVDLYKRAEAAKSKTVAQFLYRGIIELLTLVLWETPEVETIYELKTHIEQKIY